MKTVQSLLRGCAAVMSRQAATEGGSSGAEGGGGCGAGGGSGAGGGNKQESLTTSCCASTTCRITRRPRPFPSLKSHTNCVGLLSQGNAGLALCPAALVFPLPPARSCVSLPRCCSSLCCREFQVSPTLGTRSAGRTARCFVSQRRPVQIIGPRVSQHPLRRSENVDSGDVPD